MSFSPYLYIFMFRVIGDGLGEGYGMLGQAGSGKLRVSAGQSKLAAKVAKK
jgi:U4/U6 small nuclear ribonucleoprotein PRP31